MMEHYHKQYIKLTLSFLIIVSFSSFRTARSKSTLFEVGKETNFMYYFPDTGLASIVAEKIGKRVTDHVTIKEIGMIKGFFEVGPGQISNLKGIGYLTGIDTFSCYKNEVTEIPAELGKLVNLTSLDLCKAFELKKIPSEIGRLKHLTYLRLCLTEVNVIPKEIGNLKELKFLSICCNNLTSIPREIGNLQNLIDLDIHSNKLKNLPVEICRLTLLKSLDISHCGLDKLPENIGDLKELQKLNIFGNNLKTLPKSIRNLDNLSGLNVFNNFQLNDSYKNYLPKLLR